MRIRKVVGDLTTWYIRDASGNIAGIYTKTGAAGALTRYEVPVYGMGRIGVAHDQAGVLSSYEYELTDHLGNVRATISKNTANNSVNVLTYADYYPFGWNVPGRNYVSNPYRFGYQGQFAEKDDETKLNQFEARLLDTRLGRWLTFDKAGQFWSPYVSMGNNPVNAVDPDGCYAEDVHYYLTYYLALEAGFEDYEAFTIAFNNQLIDEDPATSPIAISNLDARETWHFPGTKVGGETVRNNSIVRKRVGHAISLHKLALFGQELHAYQDSYAHEGFGPALGHARIKDLHAPDRTWTDENIDKSISMAMNTYKYLLQYSGKKFTNEDWSRINGGLKDVLNYYSRRYNPNDGRSSINSLNYLLEGMSGLVRNFVNMSEVIRYKSIRFL